MLLTTLVTSWCGIHADFKVEPIITATPGNDACQVSVFLGQHTAGTETRGLADTPSEGRFPARRYHSVCITYLSQNPAVGMSSISVTGILQGQFKI